MKNSLLQLVHHKFYLYPVHRKLVFWLHRLRKKKFILSFRAKRGMTKGVEPFFRSLFRRLGTHSNNSFIGTYPNP